MSRLMEMGINRLLSNTRSFDLHGQSLFSLCDSVSFEIRESRVELFHFSLFLPGDLNIIPFQGQLLVYGKDLEPLDSLALRLLSGSLQHILHLLTEFTATSFTRYKF